MRPGFFWADLSAHGVELTRLRAQFHRANAEYHVRRRLLPQGVPMSTSQVRIVEVIALLLVVLVSGFWLAKTGRPFHGLPMNLHKFASLAAMVLVVMLVVHESHVAHLRGFEWVVCIVAAVSLLTAVVSGGVVAAQDPAPAAGLAMHRIAQDVALVSNSAAMWLVWVRYRV